MKDRYILVVDDDKDYAALTAEVLRDAGFRVAVAWNHKTALRLMKHGFLRFDLVIADVMMEYLSEGFDLARTLRNDPETREVPIVLLTGVREVYDVATEVGEDWYPCDVFLEKPIAAHDLVDTVCSLLGTEARHESQSEGTRGDTKMTLTDTTLMSALVVEDDPDYAALLAAMLLDGGYTVRTATDGVHALEQVRTERPDFITLDIQMPRQSGVLFCRQLKSDPQFRDIPVIIVTGITRDDRDTELFVHTLLDVEHLPAPHAYLEKPVEAEELLEVVRTSLRNGDRTVAQVTAGDTPAGIPRDPGVPPSLQASDCSISSGE
jgi:CheY-like chemotaxis protein